MGGRFAGSPDTLTAKMWPALEALPAHALGTCCRRRCRGPAPCPLSFASPSRKPAASDDCWKLRPRPISVHNHGYNDHGDRDRASDAPGPAVSGAR
jgi:hypothetical protein